MFTDAEIRQLLYCAAEELRARSAGKSPGPQPWLRNLVRRLELEAALSPSRHQSACEEPSSDHDQWIGSQQAAAILEWNMRRVQRHANDFDGKLIAGKLMFRESTVREYAKGLTDDRIAS